MDANKRVAKMSNELARAKWQLSSVVDARVLVVLASQARSEQLVYTLRLSDVLRERGKSGGSLYQHVKTFCQSVASKTITIQTERSIDAFPIFNRVSYIKDTKVFEIELRDFMLEHILNLKQNFTLLHIEEFVSLTGIYAQRLYMLLRSWQSVPEITITLNDLRTQLNVSKTIARFADFRRFVLQRATKEIHEKTSLHYTWEPIKKGRSVHAIRFIFASTRIEEAKQKKKHEVSVKNNELVLSAYKCAKTKTGECTQEAKSKKCDICKKLKLK